MPQSEPTQAFTVASAGFEAACKIESLPSSHRASRLHGHGFQIKLRTVLSEDDSLYTGSAPDDLVRRLQNVLSPLDHQYLNNIISNPTNENIARWIQSQLDLDVDKIAVQSTAREGVDIDRNGNAHVWQLFDFEAAHWLPNVEAGHQCGRMHGHGFKVILHASQVLGDANMAVDLDDLAHLWAGISPELEFACLNDIPGLENPTSEHLCMWLWERLEPQLECLSYVSVYGTATAGCHYDGQCFRIWKDFRFESALKLEQAPEDDRRRRMHGHSYLLRLHLQAPLDTVLGWTIDYGDVKQRFKPVLAQLDHRTLNVLPGLKTPSSAGIASWIRQRIAPGLPQLERIDCFEKTGCGSVLSWAAQGPALPI